MRARSCAPATGWVSAPVVVCLSRLVPRKGQDMLIRALPTIRSRIDGAALVIVGGGPYLPTLRRLASSLDVADHVIFTEGVAAAELPRAPRDGRRVRDAMPHPWRRTGRRGPGHRLPGGVGQRSARGGRPVRGAPESVQEGRTGFVVDGRSIDQIADAVSRILERPRSRGADGRGRTAMYLERWRWQTHAARLATLLTS